MRARRHILLVGADESRLSYLRCMLVTRGHFVVCICDNGAEALTLLAHTDYDLLIVDWPLKGAQQLLEAAKTTRHLTKTSLLAPTETHTPAGCVADWTLLKWDYSNFAVLDLACVLSQRKPGPKTRRKPAGSVGPLVVEERKLG